jgi:hypothetical protein
MNRRVTVLLGVSAVLGGCGPLPVEPEAATPGQVASAAPRASINLSDTRLLDLVTSLADARQRLLPAVSDPETGVPTEALGRALDRLSSSLVAEDGVGMMAAADDAEAAITAIPAEQAEAFGAELDAIRITLAELRQSAAPVQVITE